MIVHANDVHSSYSGDGNLKKTVQMLRTSISHLEPGATLVGPSDGYPKSACSVGRWSALQGMRFVRDTSLSMRMMFQETRRNNVVPGDDSTAALLLRRVNTDLSFALLGFVQASRSAADLVVCQACAACRCRSPCEEAAATFYYSRASRDGHLLRPAAVLTQTWQPGHADHRQCSGALRMRVQRGAVCLQAKCHESRGRLPGHEGGL